jgi:muramoyltetrapeptide carboxypeptidase
MNKISFRAISPSAAIGGYPERIKRAVENLNKELGAECTLSRHALGRSDVYGTSKPSSGTPQERAEDVMLSFTDRSVDAVICTTGGTFASEILDLLDYHVIGRNPKPIIGYSDCTTLLLAIHARTGIETFYGPALMPDFGEAGGAPEYTVSHLKKAVFGRGSFEIGQLPFILSSPVPWDKESAEKRAEEAAAPRIVVHRGTASGALVGGHLSSMLKLMGTGYLPGFDGRILFFEDCNRPVPFLVRKIVQLEQAGVFDKVVGIIVGNLRDCADGSVEPVLRRLGEEHDIPVIMGAGFGHIEPKATLPIGRQCLLDADKDRIVIGPADRDR